MATIKGFRGTRYSSKAGNLNDLTAPPYDCLNPEQREQYASHSPYNIVHVTLPEQHKDDRSKFVQYARSSARLAEWRKEDNIRSEQSLSLYRYRQTYTLGSDSPKLTRTSLVTLLKAVPYEEGIVLPHEQTFPKHKEDRLRLLEATRTHTECIFGLFEDPGDAILHLLESAKISQTVSCDSEDGVHQVLDVIEDQDFIARVAKMFEDRKIWIADGHHRYETAVNYRKSLGPKDYEIPEDYMVIALASMTDPGLVLLPTHRILANVNIPLSEHIAKLSAIFDVHEMAQEVLLAALSESPLGSFGLVLPGSKAALLTAKNSNGLLKLMNDEGSEELRHLDVTVLHRLILERILGIEGTERIGYTRNVEEAFASVNGGNSSFAYLMNPPSVENMRTLALLGEKMPQKSTYYYPKLLSGLVLWSLNDF